MKKWIVLVLLCIAVNLIAACSRSKSDIIQSTHNNQIISENNSPEINFSQSNLILDIVKETKQILQRPIPDKFDYNIVSDQDFLLVPTNQGLMIKYNVKTKQKVQIQNKEKQNLLQFGYQSFVFNDYLVTTFQNNRYSIGFSFYNQRSLEKKGSFSFVHANTILFHNNDRLYGWGEGSMGENFFVGYDKDFRHLWDFPTTERYFTFLDAFEIENNFHIICKTYGSNEKNEYLYHYVINSKTGKILIDDFLVPDKNQFSSESSVNQDRFYCKVTHLGNDIFIASQDKIGIYITKLKLNTDFSFSLLWKKYIADNKIENEIGDIINFTLGDQSFSLLSLSEKEKAYRDSLDLYCINIENGQIRWINKSLKGIDLKFYPLKNEILAESNLGKILNNNHYFYSLDIETGIIKWTKVLQDKYNEKLNKNDLSVTYNDSAFFVFDWEKQTLQRFDSKNGKESQQVFNLEKPLNGKFYVNNNHVFLLLDDRSFNSNNKISSALLYEIGE